MNFPDEPESELTAYHRLRNLKIGVPKFKVH